MKNLLAEQASFELTGTSLWAMLKSHIQYIKQMSYTSQNNQTRCQFNDAGSTRTIIHKHRKEQITFQQSNLTIVTIPYIERIFIYFLFVGFYLYYSNHKHLYNSNRSLISPHLCYISSVLGSNSSQWNIGFIHDRQALEESAASLPNPTSFSLISCREENDEG